MLVPLIASRLLQCKSAYWLSALEENGVPAGLVNSIAEAFSDQQVLARSTVQQLERADLGAVPSVRSPIRFLNNHCEQDIAPPATGDSTEAVLREIGLSKAEIKTLLDDGVVANRGD